MKKSITLLLGTAILAGCGSDSDSDQASNTYIGQIEAIDDSASTMTIHSDVLDISQARIELNDQWINSYELEEGMQVDVEFDNDIAYEIELEPEVVGAVEAITGSEITVNGQVFDITGFTSASDLVVNDWAMISGYMDATTSEWTVTAVHEVAFATRIIHSGFVSNLDKNADTFTIGTTIVQYQALDWDDEAELRDGAWVEIDEATYAAGTITAYDVDVENELDYADAEIEGTITDLTADNLMMTLNGKTDVLITSSTRFEDGLMSKDDLTVGMRVEADVVNNAGTLEAVEIERD